ncbi:flavin reductase family protein [Pectinatus haikarae]|uniref:Flavin reductase (DIM6/NTAB) family NADH-FMN oxidoreductase RutF n=1 Tax=Pectinatus haikarae TaxID=349096 RepID=A0ABT9Y7C8_9FIRM|nr:flavin reductase family protein [Pectinatus haikarae]MDQ0203734.1 flavin reductase (DIM6/NTAB) family NADH-FMN oxidoreductase RutF [Pectinatus haikarae]
MKKKIEVFAYANEIMKALGTGILLTTKAEGKINSMTIGWGNLGIVWGKPTFTVFVRENRFTNSQLAKNPEFTINIPYGNFNKKILGFCGTKSGYEVDKIGDLNLTLEPPEIIAVPAIKELPLTLECKIVYKQKHNEHAIGEETKREYYPRDVTSNFYGANKDFHTVYYGEIVSAYIIE